MIRTPAHGAGPLASPMQLTRGARPSIILPVCPEGGLGGERLVLGPIGLGRGRVVRRRGTWDLGHGIRRPPTFHPVHPVHPCSTSRHPCSSASIRVPSAAARRSSLAARRSCKPILPIPCIPVQRRSAKANPDCRNKANTNILGCSLLLAARFPWLGSAAGLPCRHRTPVFSRLCETNPFCHDSARALILHEDQDLASPISNRRCAAPEPSTRWPRQPRPGGATARPASAAWPCPSRTSMSRRTSMTPAACSAYRAARPRGGL